MKTLKEIHSIQSDLDKQKFEAMEKMRAAHREIKHLRGLQKRINVIKEKVKA